YFIFCVSFEVRLSLSRPRRASLGKLRLRHCIDRRLNLRQIEVGKLRARRGRFLNFVYGRLRLGQVDRRQQSLGFRLWLGQLRLRRLLDRVDAPALREADAPLLWLQAADAQLEPVALLDVAVRLLERAVAHFAQVQQPFEAVVQRDERAEVHDVRDGSLDQHPFVIAFQRVVPRIGEQALAAQRDAVALQVEAEDVHLDLIADLQHVARVIDAMPRQLADMDQPIRAAEVDERAEIAQPGDRSGDDISLRKLAEQARLLLRAPFALRLAIGEDPPAAVLIDLDHLDVQFLTDEVIQRFAALVPLKPGAYRDHVRRGDEAFEQSPADEDPAAIVSGDGDLDHFLAFNQLAGAVPVVLLKPHVDRHDELPLAAAGVEDVDRDFLPDAQRGAIFRIE